MMEITISKLQEELTLVKAENLLLRALGNTDEQSRFEIIFDRSALGNKIIDEDLRIIKVNKALLLLLGYDEKTLLGSSIIDFVHPDYLESWNTLRDELWNRRKPSFSIDTCLLKKDKTTIWCHVTSIIFPQDNETLGYTIIEDISERVELDRLREESRNLQFAIEKKDIENINQKKSIAMVLETQENERKRIAESLHNGIGQLLFGVKLSLERVKLDTLTVETNAVFIKHSKNLLDDAIKESRRISHELTPLILEDYGLRAALHEICEQFRGTLSLRCEISCVTDDLDKYLATAIFRIVQELILNIVKHASADSATVAMTKEDGIITLTVTDNGLGFDAKAGSDGIGLRTVRSKVQLLNGAMHIESGNNSGTQVVITVPVNEK